MLTMVDWLIVAVLGISTLVSIWRGFVKEALSLVTWLSAVNSVWPSKIRSIEC